MSIQKKPIETLKQQKESFLNYIKTKEKYSWIIADLFEDDEIEKIDNMEWVKQHLEQKWISKELTDTLEEEYTEYLRWGSYYWPIEEYPEEIKEQIMENNKKLKKIEKKVINMYKKDKEIIELNVEEFVENEFNKLNITDNEPFDKKQNWENKINKKNKERKEIENELQDIEKEIDERKYILESTNRFLKKKKKENLEEEIRNKEKKKAKKENEKADVETAIKELQKDKEKAEEIEKISERSNSDIKEIMWNNGEYKNIKEYTNAIWKVFERIEEYRKYIEKETINKIKKIITEIIRKNINEITKKIKIEIEELVEEYQKYEKYWENKNWWPIKTIFAKNRTNPRIVEICKKLWIKTNNEKADEEIDYNFINEIFVHTTWFNVLDDILEEWWLVSTNETMKRSKQNEDIGKSRTQTVTAHKDIYFSRGVKINWYWEHETDDDFVFIVNTMNNFANAWYWVPLNNEMQDFWNIIGSTDHDMTWYSIISKSSLEKNINDTSYSKIDVKDFYIFVSESKKEIIENNPKYKTENANIIYIPKELMWKMNYKLYDFMKKKIEEKDKGKEKKISIPKKIITNNDWIKSIREGNKWAFCEQIDDNTEVIYNPLKGKDYGKMIEYLEKNQEFLWIYREKINFEYLKKFLHENENAIKNFDVPFEYPKELLTLIIIFTTAFKWKTRDKYIYYVNSLIPNKISNFWYDIKNISIFSNSIEDLCDIIRHNSDPKRQKNNFKNIEEKCEIRWINFQEYKKFLKWIAKIVLNETQFNYLMKIIETGERWY